MSNPTDAFDACVRLHRRDGWSLLMWSDDLRRACMRKIENPDGDRVDFFLRPTSPSQTVVYREIIAVGSGCAIWNDLVWNGEPDSATGATRTHDFHAEQALPARQTGLTALYEG